MSSTDDSQDEARRLVAPLGAPRREDAKSGDGQGEIVDAIVTRVVDCAFKVHSSLGPGYVESVYEEALAVEFANRGIPFLRQPRFDVVYRDVVVGQGRLDFLVDRLVIVELKAVDALQQVHRSQVLSYLRATARNVGLLINFNSALLKDGIRRLSLSSSSSWRLGGLAPQEPRPDEPRLQEQSHG